MYKMYVDGFQENPLKPKTTQLIIPLIYSCEKLTVTFNIAHFDLTKTDIVLACINTEFEKYFFSLLCS
jgi:hypothetical protein